MNRRRFIFHSGGALFLPAALSRLSVNAGVHSSRSETSYAAEMPDMLESYLVRKLKHFAEKWDRKRDLLRTAGDVEARNTFAREKLLLMSGSFPERNPLHATTSDCWRQPWQTEIKPNVRKSARSDAETWGMEFGR